MHKNKYLFVFLFIGMKLNIFLFRHGAVTTKKNILGGWIDLPLGKKGLMDSRVLANKLKLEQIDFAFCSDLFRSQQNLIEVLSFHPNARVVIDPRLRERNFGALSGELASVFADTSAIQNFEGGLVEGVPGLESMVTVQKRIFPFMSDVLKLMQEKQVNVAISAHTESSVFIQQYLEGLEYDQADLLKKKSTDYKKYVVSFGD